MDINFWLKRWENNEIGFHESKVNPILVKYIKELYLIKNSRIFLPLCGKTLDIAWLLSNGYRVAGVELSEMAIEQLFMELGVKPKISLVGKINHYSAKNIDIFVGDFFDLSINILGFVDAVYDRAALVALPKEIRPRYSAHLTEITCKAPQLLVCYEYDQRLMTGPPFSVSEEEVNNYYKKNYALSLIESNNVISGLKETCKAKENIWLLKNS